MIRKLNKLSDENSSKQIRVSVFVPFFHDEFDHLMSIISQKSKKKSFSSMSLVYSYQISAQLDQYNFSCVEDTTNGSISDCLPCVNYFVEIEDYFGNVVNMKVVEGLLIYLLLNFHISILFSEIEIVT